MIGAVSPAVRETSRMTPVRMPVIEFGRTTRRIVCQRVAPMFQQASRKACGTACSDDDRNSDNVIRIIFDTCAGITGAATATANHGNGMTNSAFSAVAEITSTDDFRDTTAAIIFGAIITIQTRA